jgi:hypothetical protein
MTITAFTPEQPPLEIIGGRLHIHEFVLDGTIVDLVDEMAISDKPDELVRLMRQVAETGAVVVCHGHRRAAIDTVAAEIDRLLETTTEKTEKLPAAMQAQLNEHLVKLGTVIDAPFDGDRTSSVQHQIAELVKGATTQQVRMLLKELFGEGGPLASSSEEIAKQLKLVVGANADVLGKVTSLIEKLEQKEKLGAAHERSVHKGAPFEERIDAELTALHGRLGDEVRCVKNETGLIPGSEAGDFLVTINTAQTGGREARVVVEGKTGKLSAPKAREALKEAIVNRDAHAGILVFDGVDDAPLGGRRYLAHPDGRIIVVLDDEAGTLAFEIACSQARIVALNAIAADGAVDGKWLVSQCDKLTQLIEKASEIKRGTAAARRGLDKVDAGYDDLRQEALELIEDIKGRVA